MATINEGDLVKVTVDGILQNGVVKRVGREGKALVVEMTTSKQLRTVLADLAEKVVPEGAAKALEIGKQVHEAVLEGKVPTNETVKVIAEKIIDEKVTRQEVKETPTYPQIVGMVEVAKKPRAPRKKKQPDVVVREGGANIGKTKAMQEALAALPDGLKSKVVIGAADLPKKEEANPMADLMKQADEMADDAKVKLEKLKPSKKQTATTIEGAPIIAVKEPKGDKRRAVLHQAFLQGLSITDIANATGIKRRRVSQLRIQYIKEGMVYPKPGQADEPVYIEKLKELAKDL